MRRLQLVAKRRGEQMKARLRGTVSPPMRGACLREAGRPALSQEERTGRSICGRGGIVGHVTYSTSKARVSSYSVSVFNVNPSMITSSSTSMRMQRLPR